jgi:hypothetical protein
LGRRHRNASTEWGSAPVGSISQPGNTLVVPHDFYATNAQVLVGVFIVMAIRRRLEQSRNGTPGGLEPFFDYAQWGAILAIGLDVYALGGYDLSPVLDGIIWVATFVLLFHTSRS